VIKISPVRLVMKTRTQLDLISETNRTMGSMIVWFAVFVVSSLTYAFSVTDLSDAGAIVLLSSISVSSFVVVLYSFRYSRMNGMMREGEKKKPPQKKADDILEFRSEQKTTPVRLETSDKNQIKIGRYEYSQAEWRAIYNSLKDAGWHWNRENVAAAGVIKSITAKGVFPAFQKELVKLNVLNLADRKITSDGRAALRCAAGVRIITR